MLTQVAPEKWQRCLCRKFWNWKSERARRCRQNPTSPGEKWCPQISEAFRAIFAPTEPTPDPEREAWRAKFEEEKRQQTEREHIAYRDECARIAFEKVCPRCYRDKVETSLLAHSLAQAEAFARIQSWQFGWKGQLIQGATGLGKTRGVWSALRHAHYTGRSVLAVDGVRFASLAAKAAGDPEEEAKWQKMMISPDILFIDDLGKRFTASSGPMLFGAIDGRISHRKPLIITTNLDPGQLKGIISDPTLAEPLVRRLREFCEVIRL